MSTRPHSIVFIGDSLAIEGVASSMDNRPGIHIIRESPCSADLLDRLAAMAPDLVVTELDAPWTNGLLALLYRVPGIELAGLDFHAQRLIFMSSLHCEPQTMDDLLRTIQTRRQKTAPQTPVRIPM